MDAISGFVTVPVYRNTYQNDINIKEGVEFYFFPIQRVETAKFLNRMVVDAMVLDVVVSLLYTMWHFPIYQVYLF